MHQDLAIVILPNDNKNREITREMILPQLEKYDFEQNLIERYKDTILDIPEEDHWFNPVGQYCFYILMGDKYADDIYLEHVDRATKSPLLDYCLDLETIFACDDMWAVWMRLPHAIITPNGDWINLWTFEQMQSLGGFGSDNADYRLEAHEALRIMINHILSVLVDYKNHFAIRISYIR